MFKYKEDINPKDLEMLQPALWILLTRSMLYCAEHKLPFIVTSLISDRENVQSKSRTHEQGRAADISTVGWTETHIHRFQYLMNRWYSDIAAISFSEKKPIAALYHDAGYGSHMHLQVRPNAKWQNFIKE